MANSQYAYVRGFELADSLLSDTFIIFRLDGRSFHRFSEKHGFTKPNDLRALQLMDHAAKDLMVEHPDIVLAFGESDEYRTAFSSADQRHFTIEDNPKSSPFSPLSSLHPTSSIGQTIFQSSIQWLNTYVTTSRGDRQTVNAHINNLYNTTFWALVQRGGQTTTQAHAALKGTFSKDKHEILFSRFSINYNDIDPRFRKGSVLYRQEIPRPEIEESSTTKPLIEPEDAETVQSVQTDRGSSTKMTTTSKETTCKTQSTKIKESKRMQKQRQPIMMIEVQHADIIKDEFWAQHRSILEEER